MGGLFGYNLFYEWGEYNDWVIHKKSEKSYRKFLIFSRSFQSDRAYRNTYDLGRSLFEDEEFHQLKRQNEETVFTLGLVLPPPPAPMDFYIGFGLNYSQEHFIQENDNETYSEILGGGGPFFYKKP